MFKVSLRSRIILALVLIVTVTSTLFAGGVMLIKQQLEAVIFGDMVHDQLDVLIAQVDQGSYQQSTLFNKWQFYFDENIDQLDPIIQRLGPGSHHSVKVKDEYFQVEVGIRKTMPVYLTYNITDWENQEHELLEMLVYGVVVVLIAAIIMGRHASRTILSPVRALTIRLAEIQPKQRNVRIAHEYKGNEIGQIASAFDRYMERLDQFVDRERSFTAAASHELRTPLSVMMGAVDVLDVQGLNPASKRALSRIKRACGEMMAFIEATLFLSREDEGTISQQEPSYVNTILKSLLEDNLAQLEGNKISVSTDFQSDIELAQPDSIVQIMISNILRNAIEHTKNGTISILIFDKTLTISDSGCGIAQHDLPHIFDRSYTTKEGGNGLGLNLVKRICDRFNWFIEIESAPDKGTSVRITF